MADLKITAQVKAEPKMCHNAMDVILASLKPVAAIPVGHDESGKIPAPSTVYGDSLD